MRILTGTQMKEADRITIEDLGVPSLALMEEAGRECVDALLDALGADPEELRVLVVCGKGNNGGDGFVISRLLHRLGAEVVAIALWPLQEVAGDAGANQKGYRGLGGEVRVAEDFESFMDASEDLEGWDVVVDAVFGTGLTGPVEGWRGEVLDVLGDAPAFVLAVDVPSGLACDGPEAAQVSGPVAHADLTVTMAALKPCLVFPPARETAGEVVVAEIGIPVESLDLGGERLDLTDPEEAALWLEPLRRDPEAHKGSCGRVLVVAGSIGKGGAARMAALAALRSGAGLVTLAVPHATWQSIAMGAPEVMTEPVMEGEWGRLGLASLDRLRELSDAADVLAIGPGLGRSPETFQAVGNLLNEFSGPRIVDADGLHALAHVQDPPRGTEGSPLFLTPHPGEMAALLGEQGSRLSGMAAVREAVSRFDAHVLLKGHGSLIGGPGGHFRVNATGGPALATGGTGDILTGLVAALAAQKVASHHVLPLAAFLHGLAGDLLAESLGEIGVIATDLLEALPGVIQAGLNGWTGSGEILDDPDAGDLLGY